MLNIETLNPKNNIREIPSKLNKESIKNLRKYLNTKYFTEKELSELFKDVKDKKSWIVFTYSFFVSWNIEDEQMEIFSNYKLNSVFKIKINLTSKNFVSSIFEKNGDIKENSSELIDNFLITEIQKGMDDYFKKNFITLFDEDENFVKLLASKSITLQDFKNLSLNKKIKDANQYLGKASRNFRTKYPTALDLMSKTLTVDEISLIGKEYAFDIIFFLDGNKIELAKTILGENEPSYLKVVSIFGSIDEQAEAIYNYLVLNKNKESITDDDILKTIGELLSYQGYTTSEYVYASYPKEKTDNFTLFTKVKDILEKD